LQKGLPKDGQSQKRKSKEGGKNDGTKGVVEGAPPPKEKGACLPTETVERKAKAHLGKRSKGRAQLIASPV